MKWFCGGIVLLLLGCAKHSPQLTAPEVQAEVEQAWARSLPLALQARFQITVNGPDGSATTSGAMILHQPNRARLDIMTPLQTPMILMASNGTAMHMWVHREGLFLRGDDALAVLEEVTGGAIGLSDVLKLLTAGLPMEGAIIQHSQWSEDGIQVSLRGTDEATIEALIDPKQNTVRHLEVLRVSQSELSGTTPIMVVDIPDLMNVGRHRLPEEMSIALPGIGWSIELDVHTWDELGVIPEVFDLQPPPGAQETDLVETVKGLAESQGVHLQ